MDAHRYRSRGNCCGSPATCGDRGGSEQPAEACLASTDRAVDGGWLRHSRDHAAHRHQQDSSVALAGTLHDRWGRRLATRQDPSVAPPVAGSGGGGACGLPHTLDDPPGETTHWTAAAMAKETG